MLRVHCLGHQIPSNKTKCHRFGAVKGPILKKKRIVERPFIAPNRHFVFILVGFDAQNNTRTQHYGIS